MPKISVIIPTYNGEGTIRRAIESVICQEGNYDFEILVCDDCSTDQTVNIALDLGAKVLLNDKHTSGPNKGRNNGIKNATGDFLAFLDQDDEWLEDKIKKQMEEINKGVEIVSSQSIVRME